jgi:hypothetical protein
MDSADCLPVLNRGVLEPHLALIDAAAAAGVPRVVPSCFSVDGRDAIVRACRFREPSIT